MAELAGVTVAPPRPNPRWVRWDHTNTGLWSAIDFLDDQDQSAVPADVTDTAARARRRLLAESLPCVLGHVRGRTFPAREEEIAWAASLWSAAHNARWETLHGEAPVSGNALRIQASERLRRANA